MAQILESARKQSDIVRHIYAGAGLSIRRAHSPAPTAQLKRSRKLRSVYFADVPSAADDADEPAYYMEGMSMPTEYLPSTTISHSEIHSNRSSI